MLSKKMHNRKEGDRSFSKGERWGLEGKGERDEKGIKGAVYTHGVHTRSATLCTTNMCEYKNLQRTKN